MQFYSLERQDEFAWALLNNIKSGFFIDIGCHAPFHSSNTYVFEKELGWQGIGVDISDRSAWEEKWNWEARQKTKFIQLDATNPALTRRLMEYDVPKLVDYLSIDVDNGPNNFSFIALKRVIDANIRFKVLTIEHESYRVGPDMVRNPSRNVLLSMGYSMLFSDVILVDKVASPNIIAGSFEDWWIDPSFFDEDIFNYGGKWLTYDECVNKIKEYNI